MSEAVSTTCQDPADGISPSGERPKMELPEVKKSRKYQLAHTMRKIRLANRMMRGKRLLRVASQPLVKGHAEGTSRHRPFKKKYSKLQWKRKAPLRREKKWWSLDTKAKAKCLLYLLCLVVGVQVYNAYENLDDNLLIYDINQLEKTLHHSILGQTLAINKLTKFLRMYFSTYIHVKPLFLSIHGPTGVGKSHLGRLIAKHFKFQLGPQLVLQHSMKYQHLVGRCGQRSQQRLSDRTAAVLAQALWAKRIPVLVFDEMELAPAQLLSFVGQLLRSNYTSAVYVFISNVGQGAITQSVRRSFARRETGRVGRLSAELAQAFARRHPVWREPEIIPLFPLERVHVVQCFYQAMDREGFYPHDPRADALANTFNYFRARRRLYSQHGCKDVLSVVRQLNRQKHVGNLGSKMVTTRQDEVDEVQACKIFSIFNHSLMNYRNPTDNWACAGGDQVNVRLK
uniref:torsin-4A-like isoform X1 n=2 Tax=Pristiophorus japonicus TaxID=55135 RepID=UPI00398F46FC